jgi:hypothetical protein
LTFKIRRINNEKSDLSQNDLFPRCFQFYKCYFHRFRQLSRLEGIQNRQFEQLQIIYSESDGKKFGAGIFYTAGKEWHWSLLFPD